MRIYLAHTDGAQGDCILKGEKGVEQLPKDRAPALLVSFFYLKKFLENQERYIYRNWALDSGAFSAFNSGKTIDLQKFLETCLRLKESDPTLVEIFALDVIGDHESSLKNTEIMWKAGVEAIPTFHIGEPEDYLFHIAKNYPKIALGGVALMREPKKIAFAEQCFSRVWPKKIHGFGFGGEKSILHLPFHSVDATNWEVGPCAFGNWKSFGRMSVRGSNQNLRAEVEFYLDLERRATERWHKEMKRLETEGPTLRFAEEPGTRRKAKAKGGILKKEEK